MCNHQPKQLNNLFPIPVHIFYVLHICMIKNIEQFIVVLVRSKAGTARILLLAMQINSEAKKKLEKKTYISNFCTHLCPSNLK